jgi:peptidylprolyl isomerase
MSIISPTPGKSVQCGYSKRNVLQHDTFFYSNRSGALKAFSGLARNTGDMTRAIAFAVCALLSSAPSVAAAQAAPGTNDQATVFAPPRDALRTASGLAMVVLAKGTGTLRPKLNDCVKLRFVARASDGTVMARTQPDGSPEMNCVRRLTPGLSEAVRAMVAGEQRRVWVPARLSGPAQSTPEAPARAIDLTYELTLVELIEAPPTPSPLKTAPPAARKLASGLRLVVLSKGSGKVHPVGASRVLLHLSGWTMDGVLFECTLMAGHPASYLVAELLPGLREGVTQLVVGDHARFWIPAELAYGKKPARRRQPAGPMVYDVELLSIE